MSALEQELAAGFRGLAQDAPDDLGLLARVQSGAARRARRRRAGAGLAAALAVGGVVAVVALLPAGRGSRLDYTRDPSTFFTANTAVPTFPFTPGHLPRDVTGPPDEVLDTPTGDTLAWWTTGSLQLGTGTTRADLDPPHLSDVRPVRVQMPVAGTAGVVSCAGAAGCRATWRDPVSGLWLRVDRGGDPARARAEVLAVAAGLRREVYRPRVLLRVGLVPRGCTVTEVAPAHLAVNGPASTCDLTVALTPDVGYPGTPTTYGGRRALDAPSDHPGQHQVFVLYPGTGWDVSLVLPSSWDRPLVDALVRSISVRP